MTEAWPLGLTVSALLVPVAVLSHEAGHLAGYWAFGFPSPTLHYASSGFEGEPAFWTAVRDGDVDVAQSIVEVPLAGLSASFGLLVSYGTIGLSIFAVQRWSSLPAACLGVAAAARFPLILLLALLGRAEHTDEAHVSQALGVPFPSMVALAVVALALALIGPYRLLPSVARLRLVAAMSAGAAGGTVLWMALIGPALLP